MSARPEKFVEVDMRWSAAQTLAWIIRQEPLELKDWPAGIAPKLEPTQERLATSIGANKISAWGRKKRHGSLEQIPGGDFRISGVRLIVGPHGDLATIPRHKLSTYEGTQWEDIEFDPAEIKREWPKPPSASAIDWMRREAQRVLDHTGQPAKRDDLLKRCMKEAPCKKREAEGAFEKLPMNLRRPRGKPPKQSG
jgi:hypothetical protein